MLGVLVFWPRLARVFSRGMRILSHAEGAECAEARIVSLACGLRSARFLPTNGTNNHESLLSTDFTDDTVFVTVPSQVQRATICFIFGICWFFLTTDFTDDTDSSLTEWLCAWPPDVEQGSMADIKVFAVRSVAVNWLWLLVFWCYGDTLTDGFGRGVYMPATCAC